MNNDIKPRHGRDFDVVEHQQHVFHECNEETCSICRGGLAYCIVCHEGEAGLADSCPGETPCKK